MWCYLFLWSSYSNSFKKESPASTTPASKHGTSYTWLFDAIMLIPVHLLMFYYITLGLFWPNMDPMSPGRSVILISIISNRFWCKIMSLFATNEAICSMCHVCLPGLYCTVALSSQCQHWYVLPSCMECMCLLRLPPLTHFCSQCWQWCILPSCTD